MQQELGSMVLDACECVGPRTPLPGFGGVDRGVLSAWAAVFIDFLIRELTRLFALKRIGRMGWNQPECKRCNYTVFLRHLVIKHIDPQLCYLLALKKRVVNAKINY